MLSWPDLRQLFRQFPEGTEGNREKLCQDSRRLLRDSNFLLPEYKSDMLPFRQLARRLCVHVCCSNSVVIFKCSVFNIMSCEGQRLNWSRYFVEEIWVRHKSRNG
jgi:hypothetical protein